MTESESGNFFAIVNSSLTFALLLITGIYAYLTHRLVQAGERQSWELTRPRVQIKIGSNQGGQLIYLEIINSGTLPVENLKLSIDKNLCQQFGQTLDIREIPIFKSGVRSYMPGAIVRIALGVAHQYLAAEADRTKHLLSFKINSIYESSGRTISETYEFDVENQLSQTLRHVDYVEEFAREFPKEFKKTIENAVRQINH